MTEAERAQLRAEFRHYLDARDSHVGRIGESGEDLMKIVEQMGEKLSSKSFGKLSGEADDDSMMTARARAPNRADLHSEGSLSGLSSSDPGGEWMGPLELEMELHSQSVGKLGVKEDDGEDGKGADK